MKVFAVLILLAAAIVGGLYYAQQSADDGFDPTAQGDAARQKIQNGMTWQEVVEVAGDPKCWTEGANELKFECQYPWNEQGETDLVDAIEANDVGLGFHFQYQFSRASTWAVNFNSEGKVLNVQKRESQKDLMGG